MSVRERQWRIQRVSHTTVYLYAILSQVSNGVVNSLEIKDEVCWKVVKLYVWIDDISVS